MINNIEIVKPLLLFEKGWVYHVQIIQRKKDNPDNFMKNHRVIKHYYIRSLDYLEKKFPEMTKLADTYNARVMINLNPKDNTKVTIRCIGLLASYLEKGSDEAAYKAYSSAIGKTPSEDKKWLIDIDDVVETDFVTLGFIEELITESQPEGAKIIARIPSKTGMHLITKPFDLRAFKKWYPEIDIHKNNPTSIYIP
jgi:hypothetical protein|tara:strand:+ start:87 stop:674 length:588 start_codon:yes stop_codon:yes gene_type:complete